MRRALHRSVSLFTTLALITSMAVGVLVASAVSASAAVPAASPSFEGLRSNGDPADPLNWGDDVTPNAQLAVGPQDVVQVVSDAIGVFAKTPAHNLLGAQDLTDFWASAPAGLCVTGDSNNYQDSDVFYDGATGHWLIMTVASDGSEEAPYSYSVCLAASKTGNPMGAFNFYSVPIITSADEWLPDTGSSKFGLWNNDSLWFVTQTSCDACPGSGTSADDVPGAIGNRVWVFNTADMESGIDPRWATTVGTGNMRGQNFQGGSGTGTSGVYTDLLTPATYNAATGTPPSGRNEYLVGINFNSGTGSTGVYRVSNTWSPNTITVAANPTSINNTYNANYNTAFIPDGVPGGPHGDRLQSDFDYDVGRVVYSKVGAAESLWATHDAWTTTGFPDSGFNAVQWMKWIVSGNNAPTTTGGASQVFAPASPAVHRFLGSIAVDKTGVMGATYNVSSPNVYAGIAYTDNAGSPTALQTPEQTLASGSGILTGADDSNTSNSFGLETTTTVDPNGCTFWATGEYLPKVDAFPSTTQADEPYNTRIGSWNECSPTLLATTVSAVSGSGPASGTAYTLSANVTETASGAGVFGEDVVLSAGGSQCLGVTDDSGAVSCSAEIPPYSAGNHAGEVTATFAGDSTYATSTNTGDLLATGAAAQSITGFSNPGTQTYGDPNIPLSASAPGGAVTYTASGTCTIVAGPAAKIAAAGSCTVTAHQGGSATNAAAPDVSQTFTINKESQSITFGGGPLAGLTTVGLPTAATPIAASQLYLGASSDSGLPIRFTTNGNCTLSGETHLYGTHVGTCTVTAHQDGNANYAAATTVDQSTSITTVGTDSGTSAIAPNQATRRIDQIDHQVANNAILASGRDSTITATTATVPGVLGTISSKAITTATSTATVATYNSTAHGFTAGQAVKISGVSVGSYNGEFIIASVTANAFTVAITGGPFAGGAGGSAVVAGASEAGTTSGVNTATAHNLQVGTHVTISGSSDAGYNSSFVITAVGATGFLFTNGTSGLSNATGGTVTQDLTVCSDDGNGDVTTFHTGACTITLTPPGADADFTAAPGVSPIVATKGITKGTQAITFDSAGNHSAPFTVTATLASTGGSADDELSAGLNPGTITSTTTGVCTVSGTTTFSGHTSQETVTPVSPGACVLSASGNAGSDDWAARAATLSPAGGVNGNILIRTPQTITFANPGPLNFGDPATPLGATTTSPLTVGYQAMGDCQIVGGTQVQSTGAGSCTVSAFQGGDATYDGADPSQTFSMAKAPQSITVTGTWQSDPHMNPSSFVASATAPGGPVTFSSLTLGVCTVGGSRGATVTMVNGGTCTIRASRGVSADYLAATNVDTSFSVGSAQTISWPGSITGVHTYLDAPFGPLSAFGGEATASSSLPVNYTSSGPCSVASDGSLITMTGAGTCHIIANQPGDMNFSPATPVDHTFTIGKANQTISGFGPLASKTFGDANFNITGVTAPGTGSPGGSPITFTSSSSPPTGVCSVSGATVHIIGGGSCTVTAHQSGNGNYNAAPDVAQTFSIFPRSTTTAVKLKPSATVVGGHIEKFAVTAKSGTSKPAGVTVQIKIDGNVVATGITNAKGKVTINYTVVQTVGSHSVQAFLLPTANFAASNSPMLTLHVT